MVMGHAGSIEHRLDPDMINKVDCACGLSACSITGRGERSSAGNNDRAATLVDDVL